MSVLEVGTDHLLARVENGVALLTLNRPRARNALTREMLDALAWVLDRLDGDDSVGCIVLTGAGEAFCAGADIGEMAAGHRTAEPEPEPDGSGHALKRLRQLQQGISGRLWRMSVPTIAALPGATAGAGLSIALACDLRYAATTAKLTTAYARVGFSGDYGGAWFLARLVGAGIAHELFYFSPTLTGDDAERLGIVNAVFAPGELEAAVLAKARHLADGPRLAYRYMKENLLAAVGSELSEYLDAEAARSIACSRSDDHRAAIQAFLARPSAAPSRR
jgi:2-(1,2-epoxy-1,2-dihydrophenyl)acetyl-CoA isomerase